MPYYSVIAVNTKKKKNIEEAHCLDCQMFISHSKINHSSVLKISAASTQVTVLEITTVPTSLRAPGNRVCLGNPQIPECLYQNWDEQKPLHKHSSKNKHLSAYVEMIAWIVSELNIHRLLLQKLSKKWQSSTGFCPVFRIGSSLAAKSLIFSQQPPCTCLHFASHCLHSSKTDSKSVADAFHFKS